MTGTGEANTRLLDRVRMLAAQEDGLAVAVTSRVDGSAQASVVNAGMLDHPVTGRILFEQIIREHLDLGRPEQVHLLFARRVTKQTPGRFRTRVITEGVVPSLHVDYKSSRLKQ